MLEDPVQKIDSDNSGLYQLYLYENLFGALEKSQILNHLTSGINY